MGSHRFKRLALVALLTSLITTDSGCTKEDGSKSVSVFGEGTYGTGRKSAEAFERFFRSYVTTLASVCGSPDTGAACFLSEFCEIMNRVPLEKLMDDPEIQAVSESIRSGRSAFNEANALRYEDAFKGLEKALATGDLNAASDPKSSAVFELSLIAGTRKLGDSCYSVDECERGLICNLVSCPGRCQALPSAGEPCLSESVAEEQKSGFSLARPTALSLELCESGAYCDEKTSTCLVRKERSGSCTESRECMKGHFCRGGLCLPVKKAGEACVVLVDTCDRGLVCRGGTCNTPEGEGETCSGILVECVAGLVCREGACRPPGAEGERCAQIEASDSPQCQTGLYCAQVGRCAVRLPAGSDCTQFEECRGYCGGLLDSSKGSCRDSLPAAGEVCGAYGECDLCAACNEDSKICVATGIGAACHTDADCREDGALCDPASSRCVIKPVLGESCDPNVGCSTDFFCGPDGLCRAADRFRYESCASESQCVSENCSGRSCLGGPCRPPEIPAATPKKVEKR